MLPPKMNMQKKKLYIKIVLYFKRIKKNTQFVNKAAFQTHEFTTTTKKSWLLGKFEQNRTGNSFRCFIKCNKLQNTLSYMFVIDWADVEIDIIKLKDFHYVKRKVTTEFHDRY